MSYSVAHNKTVLFLLMLLSGAAFGAGETAARRPNVLLITLDTTRADYLSSYGFPLPTTPNLDRLARGGVRFSDAITQIPLTGPSHATILTGLYPHQHGAIRNGVPLLEEVPTLAERLKATGYQTAAFLSGWTLRRNLSGLARGFDTYDDAMEDRYRLVNTQRFAHQVTPAALEWLKAHSGGPFFLWVHYFDPHTPYIRRDEAHAALRAADATKLDAMRERNQNYASELRHVDDWIGKIFASLEELDLTSNTLIIVTADHGEAFGEHGYVGHGRRVYEEILQVPLIASWPGRLPAGKVVDVPVGLVDVAPTVSALLDLPTIGEGTDLTPLLGPEEPAKRYTMRRIFFETYPGARKGIWKLFSPKLSVIPSLAGFREGPLKFVYDAKARESRVFDLSKDRGETQNLIAQYPAYDDSGVHLVQWIQISSRGNGESEASEEDLEKLRSLGYLD